MNKGMIAGLILAGILMNVLTAGSAAGETTAAQSAFHSPEEFTAHVADAENCSNKRCHDQYLSGKRKYQHGPVALGECEVCHRAGAYPAKLGLETDQLVMCSRCHSEMAGEIQSSRSIHGPIKNGDCTSCHDPHGADEQFLLKQPYSKLCSICHSLKGLYSGEFVHKPVKDGNCGLCHDAHASNYASRLTDVGANLCLSCHEDMVSGMALDYIHAPLLQTGCTDCHDPHSGDSGLRLKAEPEEICFACHEEKRTEISHYINAHKPASEGKCLSCHSPHFSGIKFMLRERLDSLCFKCHEDSSIWKKKRFQHGPVVQGNCSACHNPHGSDNAYILRLSFPHKFYTSYKKGKYNLCFLCHKEALISEEKTTRATNFRNGETNLHRLHVHQKKGRSCRACHDIHASDQEMHIREEFPFGNVTMPMYYFKTDTGGRCIPACHRERGYDRIERIKNE